MIAYPDPLGNIKIGNQGSLADQKDPLKRLLTQIGFEHLAIKDDELNEVKKALDPENTGVVKIDALVTHLLDYVQESTDVNALTEAFQMFDAGKSGKLTMEEFEFFMTGFAKEHNQLFQDKMVKQMIEAVRKEIGDANEFEIEKMVSIFKDIWDPAKPSNK